MASPSLRNRARRFYGHVKVNWPWTLYQRLGINNLITNRRLRPVTAGPMVAGGADSCRLTRADYDALLALPGMERFRAYSFVFDKVLEYAASIRLLDLGPETVLLDAAGGYGEYAAAAKRLMSVEQVYCLDAATMPDRGDGVVRLTGDVAAMPLEDESVDAISCHHAFEHFQADADTGFLREIARVLRPGGKACIIPFFLCNAYAEIRNVRGRAVFDPLAEDVYDPFGTFPGWGPYERFARVYDVAAFERRLRPVVDGVLVPTVHEILYEGRPCPDMRRCRHQPKLNGQMKALVLTKPERGQ